MSKARVPVIEKAFGQDRLLPDLERVSHSTNDPEALQLVPSETVPAGLAPISTPARTFGWRSPLSLPVPPRVTPCSIETLSSMTAVSPTTRPVA